MCSVIEPDTSIRQNITAWATGCGIGLEALVAHVDRVDVRDQRRCAARLRAQLGSPAPAAASPPSSVGRPARRSRRAAPPVPPASAGCSAMRRARLFRMVRISAEVGRRAADRVAGAMPAHRLGVLATLALGQVGQFQVLQEQSRGTRRATGRSGNRPRPRRPGCPRSAAAATAAAGAGWCRRRRTPCCPAARGRGCRRASCGGTCGSCTPCAGSTTSPPSSASLMLRLPALSCTALRICDFARRMKRCRLARLLPLGSGGGRRCASVCL